MEEKETKQYEEKGSDLLNLIISKTFSRHSQLTEEEFLKEIGFEDSGKTENEALRIAFMNVLVASTAELIKAKDSFKMGMSLMKTYLIDENIADNEKEGE